MYSCFKIFINVIITFVLLSLFTIYIRIYIIVLLHFWGINNYCPIIYNIYYYKIINIYNFPIKRYA